MPPMQVWIDPPRRGRTIDHSDSRDPPRSGALLPEAGGGITGGLGWPLHETGTRLDRSDPAGPLVPASDNLCYWFVL